MSDQTPGASGHGPTPPTSQVSGAPRTSAHLCTVSAATTLCVLIVMGINQQLTHQPVLATSLAPSIFLLFWQPDNTMNSLLPLLVGYLASLVLPLPYGSVAVSVAVTVLLLGALRLLQPRPYPPAWRSPAGCTTCLRWRFPSRWRWRICCCWCAGCCSVMLVGIACARIRRTVFAGLGCLNAVSNL